MQETEHYKLKKPSAEDFYNIADQNGNMDKVDAALHELEEGKADLDLITGKVRGDQLPSMNYESPLKDTSAKAYPMDNDGIVLVDNGDSKTKRVLWSSIKTTLKTWLDTLYISVTTTFIRLSGINPLSAGDFIDIGDRDTPCELRVWGPISAQSNRITGVSWPSHENDAANMGYVDSRSAADFGAAPSTHTHAPADLTSAVPINLGGTGAATAAAARAALAALAAFPPTAITISATWSGTGPWTQSIAVAGVLAAWDWRLGLHLAKITDDAARKLQEKAYGCITWCETYNGGITLTCRDKKPDVAISAVLAGEV